MDQGTPPFDPPPAPPPPYITLPAPPPPPAIPITVEVFNALLVKIPENPPPYR